MYNGRKRVKLENWYVYPFLPPANEVCEGYVFTPVCHSVHGGGGADIPQADTP